jgi:hypothetical protein
MGGDDSAGTGIRSETRIVAGHGSFGVPGGQRESLRRPVRQTSPGPGIEFLMAHFLHIRQHADDLGALSPVQLHDFTRTMRRRLASLPRPEIK